VNPSTQPPQAAKERLAETLGEFAEGLAANGGGNGLSALLISLINLIIEALRSIAWTLPETTAPDETEAGEADAGQTPSTPSPTPKTPDRPEHPSSARGDPPRRRTPKRTEHPGPKAGTAAQFRPRPRPARSPGPPAKASAPAPPQPAAARNAKTLADCGPCLGAS
jgi:hypothetical protein